MPKALGIHHVTAIASDPQRNVDFYAGTLGLRLVKRTVNFDDPQTYHLYFGDEIGTPGTILTFFPWPGARRGRQGARQVAVTSFAIRPGAIGFWVERLLRSGISFQGPRKRELGAVRGEQTLAFRDPDGLMLEIVAHEGAVERSGWGGAPGIPAEQALRGFHAVELWVEHGEPTHRVLEALGFELVGEEENIRRYSSGGAGAGTLVDVRAVGGFLRGADGVGTVHHVAWSVADDAAQLEMRAMVIAAGLEPTAVIDRSYFHSVYFREPGGILYELATKLPGFAIDESVERLGESLMLPPQYEPMRTSIENALPPIHLPTRRTEEDMMSLAEGSGEGQALGFVHRYLPAASPAMKGGATLLLLHGTGGDEEDLIPLGRAILPGAAILSPRGRVLERGMPRFFRRLAEGVFDQEDLARRTDELAEFVRAAAAAYGFRPENVIPVGFSNGANIAASLLLRHPGLVGRTVLLSPMVPFEPEKPVDLAGTSVFIGAGRNDPIAPPEQAEGLAALLRRMGATVKLHWEPSGHELTVGMVRAVNTWLSKGIEDRGSTSIIDH